MCLRSCDVRLSHFKMMIFELYLTFYVGLNNSVNRGYKRGNYYLHHVTYHSCVGTGGKGDTIEMENETSGTGLTTTKKLGVRNESQAKEGARHCGEKSERVEVKEGIAEE
jgi:hypothetical protein